MNTNRIRNTKPEKVWPMIYRQGYKTTKRMTPHLSHVLINIPGNCGKFLIHLITSSSIDNTITYSTQLLKNYNAQLPLTEKTSLSTLRTLFEYLIKQSILIPIAEKRYCITPIIAYHPDYINIKQYDKNIIDPYLKYTDWLKWAKSKPNRLKPKINIPAFLKIIAEKHIELIQKRRDQRTAARPNLYTTRKTKTIYNKK